MPPSLFQPSAMRSIIPSTTTRRLFSSTSFLARPREDFTPSLSRSSDSNTDTSSSPSSRPSYPQRSQSSRLASLTQDRAAANTSRASNDANPKLRSFGNDAIDRLMSYRNRARSVQENQVETQRLLREQKTAREYLKQMPRRWKAGDVYSPHDLSSVEMTKWRKRSTKGPDLVDALNLKPLDMYKNFSLLNHFTSSSGQILHSKMTQLRPVNQRKVAKMIRRAQGMGIYPSIHAHPEMLRGDFFPDRYM